MKRSPLVDDHILNLLERYWVSKPSARSICITGPEHIGKMTLAMWFVQGAHCINNHPRPCDECRECKRFTNRIDPDFRIVADDEKSVGIEEIRSPMEWLHQRALSEKGKWFVIPSIHRLTREAQHALLKILEEPPDSTVIIATTDQPQRILPTLRSRMLMLRLRPQSKEHLVEYIREQTASLPEVIQYVQGCIGNYYRLIEDDQMKKEKEEREQALEFLKTFPADRWRSWNDDIVRDTSGTRDWLRSLESALEETIQRKQNTFSGQLPRIYAMIRSAHTVPGSQQKGLFKQWCCQWPTVT